MMFFSFVFDSPLGEITVACDESNRLVGLWLENQKHFGGKILSRAEKASRSGFAARPVFTAAENWISAYFSGANPDASALPLAPLGSDFQRRVWDILLTIPYGKTITYKDIALRLATDNTQIPCNSESDSCGAKERKTGCRASVKSSGTGGEVPCSSIEARRISCQAVGGAVGRNPLSIIIPCHRVVGSGGSLTGYAGGIDKKLFLLQHENADTSRFFIPASR